MDSRIPEDMTPDAWAVSVQYCDRCRQEYPTPEGAIHVVVNGDGEEMERCVNVAQCNSHLVSNALETLEMLLYGLEQDAIPTVDRSRLHDTYMTAYSDLCQAVYDVPYNPYGEGTCDRCNSPLGEDGIQRARAGERNVLCFFCTVADIKAVME